MLLKQWSMTSNLKLRAAYAGSAIAFLFCSSTLRGEVRSDTNTVTLDQFLSLKQQNDLLQQQVRRQQELIESLMHKVSAIEDANAKRDHNTSETLQTKPADETPPPGSPFHFGNVNLSGEGGAAFFHSQSLGQTPNAEFRIDEARVFLEAPIWKDVYLFSELDLAQREVTDLTLRAGELYLDFEDVSQLWGADRLLNLRVGRFNIPFGEEYQYRYAIDNPLISHSVMDLWGVDEGLELYGRIGRVQYVAAVQNGGLPTSQDFNADKAVVGRVSYDPTKWLHLSLSGMRTGDLDVANDQLSAMWFGNGWFRSLGSAATTQFHVNLVEGDVQFRFPGILVRTAGGYVGYADNDPAGPNHRDVYYYYLEGVKDLTRKLYAAARLSEVFAPGGFPIVGNGNMSEYLFGPLTTDYWRLGLGMGYRFSSNLIVKGEYSLNEGHVANGQPRRQENLFALEAAFRF